MLEVENLSPFSSLVFSTVDVHDRLFETVVVRGTFALEATAATATITHVLTLLDDQPPILVSDVHFEGAFAAEVRAESDLAPYKPKCDVVVIGSAYSPSGAATSAIGVGVRVERDADMFPADAPFPGGLLLDKHLIVHGERFFYRHDAFDRAAAALVGRLSFGKVQASEWRLGPPEPFVNCPIRYAYAYGGSVTVLARDEAAIARLAEDRRPTPGSTYDDPSAIVTQEDYPANPIGIGFMRPWYAAAAEIDRWPAPRIGSADIAAFETSTRVDSEEQPQDAEPQGLGIVAKQWRTRLRLAGTCDERWQRERFPKVPEDFDDAYWNGAPPSMQCDHLIGQETVSLTNLLPTGTRDGVAAFALPRVGLSLRLERADSGVIYEALRIDTLHIDLDAMRVALVWRLRIPHDDHHARCKLMALAPIIDEHPELMPGLLASTLRSRLSLEQEHA